MKTQTEFRQKQAHFSWVYEASQTSLAQSRQMCNFTALGWLLVWTHRDFGQYVTEGRIPLVFRKLSSQLQYFSFTIKIR